MATTYAWVGVPDKTSVYVSYVVSSADSARLAYTTDSTYATGLVYTGAQTPDATGSVRFLVSGLTANTKYYYAVETTAAGVATLEAGHRGSFTTDSGAAKSFMFTAGGCQHPTHDTIAWPQMKAAGSELMLITGDFGYPDITTNDPAAFRTHWNNTVSRPDITAFMKDVPTSVVWDDHDYAGDAADRASAARPAAGLVMRERNPMGPKMSATDGVGCYHTFSRGRVRFIMLDCRAYRDPNGTVASATKTMLGTEQKQWLKDTLDNSPEPVVVIVSPLSWACEDAVGDNIEHWGGYQNEQAELNDFFHARQHRGRIMIISGDVHALGFDYGPEQTQGNYPCFQVSSLGGTNSTKALAFAQFGPYPADGSAVNLYGKFEVTDTGGDMISVRFGAMDANLNTGAGGEVYTYTWKFGADGKGWPQVAPVLHIDAKDITGVADGAALPTTAGVVPDRAGNYPLSVAGADVAKAPIYRSTGLNGPSLEFDGAKLLANTTPAGITAGKKWQKVYAAVKPTSIAAGDRAIYYVPIADAAAPFRVRNGIYTSADAVKLVGRAVDAEGADALTTAIGQFVAGDPIVVYGMRDIPLNDAYVHSAPVGGSAFSGTFNDVATAWPAGESLFIHVGGTDVPSFIGHIAAIVVVNGIDAAPPEPDTDYWREQMMFRAGLKTPIPLPSAAAAPKMFAWINGVKTAVTMKLI